MGRTLPKACKVLLSMLTLSEEEVSNPAAFLEKVFEAWVGCQTGPSRYCA